MKLRGTAVFSSVGQLYHLFNDRQKRVFNWIVFVTFLSSISDLFGLATFLPVVGMVLDHNFYNKILLYLPDYFGHFSPSHLLLIFSAAFFLILIAKNLFGLYINWLQVRFVRNFYVSSSMNVLNKLYDRTLLDIQKDTSNELVHKLTSMQISLCSYAAISTLIIINEAMVFSITAIAVCIIDWKLFLLLIAIIAPTMGYFYYRVKSTINSAGVQKSDDSIQLYANAQEMIVGFTDIKIAGTQKNFKKTFEATARRYSVQQAKIDFMMFIPTRIIEIATFLCVILILLYGVYVIKDPTKIVATITLFAVVAYRCVPSINRFVMAINNLNSTEFIFKDPDFYPARHLEEAESTQAMAFNDKIKFDHVSYRYAKNMKFVVKDCNLEIHKGEKIGIVGKSGSGKSTLINNILGFLHPTEGSIYIDGVQLTRKNVADWWRIVGYVRQEVFMMNTTFLENIAIGEHPDSIDMERVNRAVQLASLTQLVNDLPNGLQTIINERGNNLSGGQKQRISIARAIYKGAKILIFDEATSALDTKTEEEITNSIRKLGDENLTIVIIAHRHTSLKYCDKIYSLENGMVTDCFSYNDLVTHFSKE